MKRTLLTFSSSLILAAIAAPTIAININNSSLSHPESYQILASNSSLERHYEQSGNFSFVPPSGWQLGDLPGMKYKVAFGTFSDDFTPNINVIDEVYDGSLDNYVELNLGVMQRVSPEFKLISQQEFVNNTGAKAVKLVTDNSLFGRQLRQTFYLFESGQTKYVATCTRLIGSKQAAVDTQCEESMRTFRIEL